MLWFLHYFSSCSWSGVLHVPPLPRRYPPIFIYFFNSIQCIMRHINTDILSNDTYTYVNIEMRIMFHLSICLYIHLFAYISISLHESPDSIFLPEQAGELLQGVRRCLRLGVGGAHSPSDLRHGPLHMGFLHTYVYNNSSSRTIRRVEIEEYYY